MGWGNEFGERDFASSDEAGQMADDGADGQFALFGDFIGLFALLV